MSELDWKFFELGGMILAFLGAFVLAGKFFDRGGRG